MTQLSNRLEVLLSLVTPGNRLIDVGCDHGFVPIALCERGVIPSALAMDINKGPLERADQHIREAGLEERIKTRISNGMDKLNEGEGDTLLIAGMGGLLIVDILERGKKILPSLKELVLSPHSDVHLVREAIMKHGFRIVEERFLKEEGKYYTMIRAIPVDNHRDQKLESQIAELEKKTSEVELYYGPCLLREKHPVLLQSLLHEKQVQEELIQKLQKANTDGARKRILEVEQELKRIEEALALF